MTWRLIRLVGAAAAVGMTSCSPNADQELQSSQDSAVAADSATQFVRVLYSDYVKDVTGKGGGPAWFEMLPRDPAVLGHELLAALRADSAIRQGFPGEIVGIDFDPIVGSQDPCEEYEVGQGVSKDGHVDVPIYGTCTRIDRARPSVVVEVNVEGGRWRVRNIRYPEHSTDLLKLLKDLRGSM